MLNAEVFSRLGSSSTTSTVMLINSGDVVGNASFQVGRASTNASVTWNESGAYWTAGLLGAETKVVTLTSGGLLPVVDGSNVTNITGSHVNNAVLNTGSYSNPSWIVALPAAVITSGTLADTLLSTNVVKTTSTYANPAWLTDLSASSLTSGTVPAAALPSPTVSTLGGVQAIAPVTSKWVSSISTSGVPSLAQPAFTDITGTVPTAALPTPTTSTLGGVKAISSVSSQWINSISTAGVPALSQPAFTDITGTVTAAQLASSTALLSTNNLSDVSNKATALTNLGASGGTIAGPTFTGKIILESTVSTILTSPTINQASGRFRLPSGSTGPFTISNSLVELGSIIILTLASTDATAAGLSVQANAGSFYVNLKTAATSPVYVNFITINPKAP